MSDRPPKFLETRMLSVIKELDSRVSSERDRLADELKEVEQQAAELRTAIGKIDAYLGYKPSSRSAPAAQPSASQEEQPKRTRTPRGDGNSLRARVLQIIQEHPDGLTSKDIRLAFQMDDKKGRQAIANALSVLKNDDKVITQTKDRGPYVAVEHPQEDAQGTD